jgi:hypothetical protein
MADSDTENDLVIATSASRILVRIKPDGTLLYGPEYTPDEAAEVLWQALARRRADAAVKEVLYAQMEHALTTVGRADLANEAAQAAATEQGGMGKAGSQAVLGAHQALRKLEAAVHAVIELGRGLAERAVEPELAQKKHLPSSQN